MCIISKYEDIYRRLIVSISYYHIYFRFDFPLIDIVVAMWLHIKLNLVNICALTAELVLEGTS